MLPFDLHVLGLPPAFTLSQDQTLHLSIATRLHAFDSAGLIYALSAVSTQAQTDSLLAFACFLEFHLDCVSNIC